MNKNFNISTSNEDTSEEIIKKFIEKTVEIIHEEFKQTGEVKPALFFAKETNEGKSGFGLCPGLEELMNTDENKDKLSKILKSMLKEVKPVCACLITEAWMVEGEKNKDSVDDKGFYKPGALMPSKDPDRIEVVMLSFETYTKEMRMTFAIKRDKEPAYLEEMVKLKELSEWQDKDKTSGRFTNLLSNSLSNEDEDDNEYGVRVKLAKDFKEAQQMMEEDMLMSNKRTVEFFNMMSKMGEAAGVKTTGAYPNGTRIAKTNTEEGDATENDVEGTVLGAIGAPPIEQLPPELRSKNIKHAYLVKWDNFDQPVVVIDYKVRKL